MDQTLISTSLLAENRANNLELKEKKTTLCYCLYARKSSEDDERQALSIDSQIHEMQELAKREGMDIAEIRRESHSAKTSCERPEFNRLMADIDKGMFNAVMTWAPDRLSRNAGDLGMLVDLMDKGRLHEIRTPSQKFTNSPNEKFLLMILGSQAKLENDNRGINVRRGLKNKVEMGWRPGLPPLGYLNERSINRGQNKIFIDEERSTIIKKIFEMVGFQHTTGRVVYNYLKEINFKTRTNKSVTLSSVYLLLKNPFYYGMFEYPVKSKKWYKGAHEPLITKELFDRVQDQLTTPDRPTYGQKEFQFTKMFTCGGCGSGITAEEKIKRNKGNGNIHRYVYYRCSKSKGEVCNEQPVCEKDVLDQLLKIIDEINLDQIGAKKRIEEEMNRYKAFAEGVLGEKIAKPKQKEVSIRKFAKHILTHGTRDEKREILEHLQNAIVIKDRGLKIKNKE
ncbi:MAG: recombinase family protein [Candidatus Uhrbacteria bacterium]